MPLSTKTVVIASGIAGAMLLVGCCAGGGVVWLLTRQPSNAGPIPVVLTAPPADTSAEEAVMKDILALPFWDQGAAKAETVNQIVKLIQTNDRGVVFFASDGKTCCVDFPGSGGSDLAVHSSGNAWSPEVQALPLKRVFARPRFRCSRQSALDAIFLAARRPTTADYFTPQRIP